MQSDLNQNRPESNSERGAVKSAALGKVGKKIREIRKLNNLSLKELADKSGVTAGLLSRIENFRALPSLPVLHNVAIALDVPLSELVVDVDNDEHEYILIRKGAGEVEQRYDSEGLLYENLFSQPLNDINMRANIVTIKPDTYRPPISNNGMELLYVVAGEIEYGLDSNLLQLSEGDTLYFNGKVPHSLHNTSSNTTVLFKVYFLKEQ